MNARLTKRHCHGLTFVELLIVLGVVAVLAAILLPSIGRARYREAAAECGNNLKQVGIAFITWAVDHDDKFPMQVPASEGGTLEAGPSAVQHFRAVSDALSAPKVLVCPADRERKAADSFGSGLSGATLSYFVGLDAVETNSTMLLCGDRNLSNGFGITRGVLELTTNETAGWTQELHVGHGNIVLSDGSVELLSTARLRDALALTGLATNRLAMP